MVATTIFIGLGVSLVLFIRSGLDVWRTGELRRETFERSQAILDQIESDLHATFSDARTRGRTEVSVKFVSDYDPNGCQRLRFVRSLDGETRHRITRRAGELTGGRYDIDDVNDAWETEEFLHRPPGGLQEVAYLRGLGPAASTLWRASRSPIGGERTLFDETNLYEWSGDAPVGVRAGLPIGGGILYLEYNFWGQQTESWNSASEGGALPFWDSTNVEREEGTFPESALEWRDDVFPDSVQVVIVLRPARAVRLARLRGTLGANDTEIVADNLDGYPDGGFQYVKIDDEWIRYGARVGNQLLECERGVRGTEAAEHRPNREVLYGSSFSRIVRIPASKHSRWRGQP